MRQYLGVPYLRTAVRRVESVRTHAGHSSWRNSRAPALSGGVVWWCEDNSWSVAQLARSRAIGFMLGCAQSNLPAYQQAVASVFGTESSVCYGTPYRARSIQRATGGCAGGE